MRILLLLAHPDPASFNHAIASMALQEMTRQGHEIAFHDLYAEGFDPILTAEEIPQMAEIPGGIRRHCEDLATAEGLIVVHPNWWGQPPAILKGWVDRVLRPGVAYRFLDGDGGEGVPEGLLRIQTAVIFNTSNTPAPREHDVFGDPLERLWKDCILGLCGVTSVRRRMFRVVITSSAEERAAWLAEAREMLVDAFPTA